MFIKDENEETCTVTIKNVPKKIKKLLDIMSISPTNDFNMLYGENKETRKANLFTHMVLAKYIQTRSVKGLKNHGIELDVESVPQNPDFKDIFPEI